MLIYMEHEHVETYVGERSKSARYQMEISIIQHTSTSSWTCKSSRHFQADEQG